MQEQIDALERENKRLRNDLERLKSKSNKQATHKKSILKFVGHSFAGKRLKKSIYKFLDEYNATKQVTRHTLSDLLASILYRVTRIGLFTIIFTVLPSLLLIQQNVLLQQQNKKIQDQNHLAEASRRSAQMFIMGDVLSDINSELKQGHVRLSPTLTGRVISLSRAMKPYRYFENGTLKTNMMSPERGQLLITLSQSKIQGSYLSDAIYQNSDFTYADLLRTNFIGAHLQDVNLAHADLSHSELSNANLSYSNLSNSKLHNVDFTDSKLKLVDFTRADLTNSNLRYADITRANFTDAIMDKVIVDRPDWLEYVVNTLKLKGGEKLQKDYKVDSLPGPSGKKMPTLIRQASLF